MNDSVVKVKVESDRLQGHSGLVTPFSFDKRQNGNMSGDHTALMSVKYSDFVIKGSQRSNTL